MLKLQKEIDEAANNYNKTKDPQYKDLWYKLIKEIASTHGYYNSKRRTLPFDSNIKTDDGWNSIDK
jgi:hypothetical protein